eukprot:6077722-Pleurochrysis_carterae.AAC.1
MIFPLCANITAVLPSPPAACFPSQPAEPHLSAFPLSPRPTSFTPLLSHSLRAGEYLASIGGEDDNNL